MKYIIRNDEPGAWHHVMNRGLSKMPIFEGPKDYRYFMACLALAVHSGWLEVHAYSLLDNHFHLLVRSPIGKLSFAMQQIESRYVTRFNRRYHRDGPLFRGRFRSKRIESDVYWWSVVRYIDQNPVESGFVQSPVEYPYGSARYYARRSGPQWLSRHFIESVVCGYIDKKTYLPRYYTDFFDPYFSSTQREIIQKITDTADDTVERFDELVHGDSDQAQSWLVEKADHAHGSKPGMPLLNGRTVMTEVTKFRTEKPYYTVHYKGRDRDGWPILSAGLLRTICGSSLKEITDWLECALTTASRLVETHIDLLKSDYDYARNASNIVVAAFDIDWPDSSGRKKSIIIGSANLS